MTPRYPLVGCLAAGLVGCGLLLVGCNSPLIRSQSPEVDVAATVEESEARLPTTRLVGDMAIASGLQYLRVQGVGLVNHLDGTGSDPPPSPLRSALVEEIQSHDVSGVNRLLASNDNALVTLSADLPPGVQKGDLFDVEVRVPMRSKTTSLRSGFLLPARLQEMQLLDNAIRTGHVSATATGPVVVDAIFRGDGDEIHEVRGRILGGGRALMSRPLHLVLKPEHRSPQLSQAIGVVLNGRFHRYDHGDRTGVAKPLNDKMVEISVHPRYKHNVSRYMRVLRAVALNESAAERLERMALLQRKLLEPTSAARAAIELEAIGEDAVPALRQGLGSSDPEVRFYSAEALAYLDVDDAADALADAAESEPAFRWHSLTALSTMDHVSAYDALVTLLHSSSAETRYGAFRALRTRNPRDPMVRPVAAWQGVEYHVVPTHGPELIHFSRSRQAEITLFGNDIGMRPPAFLFAGKKILIKATADGQIKVSRFSTDDAGDQHILCPPRLDPVLRAVAELGGSYGDMMQMVSEARASGDLQAKLVVDALARPGRRYYRDAKDEEADSERAGGIRAANPVPELFGGRDSSAEPERGPRHTSEPYVAEEPEEESESSFFAKMFGWSN